MNINFILSATPNIILGYIFLSIILLNMSSFEILLTEDDINLIGNLWQKRKTKIKQIVLEKLYLKTSMFFFHFKICFPYFCESFYFFKKISSDFFFLSLCISIWKYKLHVTYKPALFLADFSFNLKKNFP